ncbi:glycoside hydrolase family 19 protein [Paenibacillus arenosi]|uniref:Chitinase n=1 Tax=Paenibacillus arenosi TaxID=2774142 RepID=A0ABR9ATL8_9BACL|nr:glycoside hydrolase family 19 protein [Paenibacillus arenosi]MBD8497029.1 chitinase [Paenibacillus arenosi]
MKQKYPFSRSFLLRTLTAAISVSMLASGTAAFAATAPLAQSASAQIANAPAPWSATQAYTAGSRVSYNGQVFEAKWWTQGETPNASNQWGAWKVVSGGGQNDTIAPTAPTNVASPSQSATSITLNWNASTDNVGVTAYDIYRNNVKAGTATTTTFTDTGLQALTSYSYKVRALDAAGNFADSTALTVSTSNVPIPGDDLTVGQSRVLTDAQVQSTWGGIDPQYGPDLAVQAVQSILPKAEFELLFPMRIGTAEWHNFAKTKDYYKPNQADYYSYDNLIAAVRDVANIKYKIVYREGSTWTHQIFRLDKAAKKETLLYEEKDFNSEWNRNKAKIPYITDFGTFLKEGTENNKKRELAAFLANISHETGGGWATAPGGELRWALFWNEEMAYINQPGRVGYVAASTDYPAVAGKSYHGRGPMQLSWNYNYGLIGSIIFGDKNVLLQNPEMITNEGKLGFMTAILFWMTPQSPKPSNHDIIVGNYVPTAAQLAKGLVPGFGATIMVINGGLEGNKDETDYRVKRRVAHYRDITTRVGANIQGEKLDTLGMQPF